MSSQVALNFWKTLFNWHVIGGRNIARAPVSSIRWVADSMWWMLALSKITTLLALTPLYGSNWGSKHALQKVTNFLTVYALL